jgi:hypothetical protein
MHPTSQPSSVAERPDVLRVEALPFCHLSLVGLGNVHALLHLLVAPSVLGHPQQRLRHEHPRFLSRCDLREVEPPGVTVKSPSLRVLGKHGLVCGG